MSRISRKLISFALVMMMMVSVMPVGLAEAQLWQETDMADGWTMITNDGGATLGYSKSSGLPIIYADGYAFKDLNRNGALDTFEDWRVDYVERAKSLVETEELSPEWMMGFKMNPFSIGAASEKELLDVTKNALDIGYREVRYPGGSAQTVVGWNNMIQQYVESMDQIVCIPTTYIADPLGGDGVSFWPGYLGLAASFDPELAAQYGEMLSKEWRALGISMKVAPQIDLATEPRWKRVDMTFGEDPQLSIDMSVAMINAWQSSYDEEGNDLGWGADSVNTQIKHFPGDGAAEAGRESHTLDGAYTVYPGGQFYTSILPFVACLNLPGKTGATSSAMTNFSVALDEFGEPISGERVATSFNSWIINDLWRGIYNWDGYILTDFAVYNGKQFGVEDLSVPERLLKMLEAGSDAFGGLGGKYDEDVATAMEAYAIGVEKHGQEGMDKIMDDSTVHILQTLFNVGVVDNPYLTVEKALTVANSAEHSAAAFDAQVKSIVMLKNSGNVIAQATDAKQTVYVPWKYVAAVQSYRGTTPASFVPSIDLKEALKYYNVVTDKAGQPTGPNDESGNPTYTQDDVIRATAEELATCDFALVRIQSPQSGNPTTGYDEAGVTVPEGYEYLPISLQYRPYTADNMYVRFDSIGGQITSREVQGVYGLETIYEKENRSYYGKTGIITNESDLDFVLYAASACDKVVVAVDIKNSMVFSELEGEVDAIVAAWSGDRANPIDDAAFLEIISGKVEPSGLLPMQMPLDMETVEAQFEDVPRDMECYVDADGNTYDFTFGMNWSGVIDDERVAKYNVDPIVGEDPFN